MLGIRHGHDSILLNNGKVLITGGSVNAFAQFNTQSAELFDPVTNVYTSSPTSSEGVGARFSASQLSLLLRNGNVIVSGGQYFFVQDSSSDVRADAFECNPVAASTLFTVILREALNLASVGVWKITQCRSLKQTDYVRRAA